MSKLFHLIEDATVILRTKTGVYKQTSLFYKGDRVYAKTGGGYVRLHAQGGTSCPSVLWEDLDGAGHVNVPRTGGPTYSEIVPYVKRAA